LEEAYRLHSTSGSLERIKDETHRALDFSVGIKIYDAVAAIDETDRWLHLEFPTACLIQLAAAHPRFEDVQLGLRHRAF
jgi:hypothetical protein